MTKPGWFQFLTVMMLAPSPATPTSREQTRHPGPPPSLLDAPQVWQIPILALVVEAVADDVHVRHLEADIVGLQIDLAAVRLVEAYDAALIPSDTAFTIIHSYDQPFYNFFITRGSNAPGYDDLLFRQTGGPISWNVSGDGIGMFIGHATTTKRILP